MYASYTLSLYYEERFLILGLEAIDNSETYTDIDWNSLLGTELSTFQYEQCSVANLAKASILVNKKLKELFMKDVLVVLGEKKVNKWKSRYSWVVAESVIREESLLLPQKCSRCKFSFGNYYMRHEPSLKEDCFEPKDILWKGRVKES